MAASVQRNSRRRRELDMDQQRRRCRRTWCRKRVPVSRGLPSARRVYGAKRYPRCMLVAVWRVLWLGACT